MITMATIALSLGGCARMQQNIADNDNRQCSGMGLTFGTPAFAQCRLYLGEQRRQQFNEGIDTMARGLERKRSPDVYIIER